MKSAKYLWILLVVIIVSILCSCNGAKSKSVEKKIDIVEVLSKTEPAPETDFEFELTNDAKGVVLRKYKGSAKYLVIPETIQGVPVFEISPIADATPFLVPYNTEKAVEKSNGELFMSGVEGIKFPSNLKIIGAYAFYKNNINAIIFNSTLEIIGTYAFAKAYDTDSFKYGWVKKMILPPTIKNMGGQAFKESRIFTKLELPTSLDKVSLNAFEDCRELVEVTLPSTLKFIQTGAFKNCQKLSSIELTEDLKEVNNATVSNIKKPPRLPSTLKAIDSEAFYNTGLKSIEIPIGVKAIGKDAFGKCDQLADIKIPQKLSCVEIDLLVIGINKNDKPYLWYVKPKQSKDFSDFFSGEKISQSLALQRILKEHKTHRINLETNWLGDYQSVKIYNWNW